MRSSQINVPRILVADDEPEILNGYASILKRSHEPSETERTLADLDAQLFGLTAENARPASFDVCTCRQGEEAVAAVRAAKKAGRPFSVAFLDVRMPPGLDGVAAAKQIRAIDPLVNIVIVTGYSNLQPQLIAEQAPPIHRLLYCQKPLQMEELEHFARSLTAKWQAETERDEAAARLQRLVSTNPAVIYSCAAGEEFAVTYVSQNITEQFGYAPGELTDDVGFWANRIHADDRQAAFAELNSLSDRGRHNHVFRFLRKDGTCRLVQNEIRLLRDDNGQALEIVGCLIDITDRN